MPPASPVSPAISAKIIHAALMLGVILFYGVAWYVGTRTSMPVSAVPDRRVLYVGLFLFSAVLFGAAYQCRRHSRNRYSGKGAPRDESAGEENSWAGLHFRKTTLAGTSGSPLDQPAHSAAGEHGR